MRITYLLPLPELGGGNKVIFQHAALLRGQGHEVSVAAEGPRPGWVRLDGPYWDYTSGGSPPGSQDLVIATYWTTIPLARRLGLGPLAHFCQGYEGGLAHLRPVLPEIEAAYSLALPTLTVAPHLAELLRARFGRESVLAPPPLDPRFRPAPRLGPRRPPWIAVPGLFQAPVKGVATALEAIALLRRQGLDCRVLRFAVLPLTAEERERLAPDVYLCGVPPAAIARALRRCDLLLLPSREEEGFGLPLLEAMASGVPAVASRIPSTLHIAEAVAGAAELVPPGDAAAMAGAAGRLLADPGVWRRARRAGRRAALRFHPRMMGPALAAAVQWARERALPA